MGGICCRARQELRKKIPSLVLSPNLLPRFSNPLPPAQLTSSHSRRKPWLDRASWWAWGDAVLSLNTDWPEDGGAPPTHHIRNSAYAPLGLLSIHFEGSSVWDPQMGVLDFVFRKMTVMVGAFRLPPLRLPPFGPRSRAASRDLLLGRAPGDKGDLSHGAAGGGGQRRPQRSFVSAAAASGDASAPAAVPWSSPAMPSSAAAATTPQPEGMLEDPWDDSPAAAPSGGGPRGRTEEKGGEPGLLPAQPQGEEPQEPLGSVVAAARGMQARVSGHGWYEPGLSEQPPLPEEEPFLPPEEEPRLWHYDGWHGGPPLAHEPVGEREPLDAAPPLRPLPEEETGEEGAKPPGGDGGGEAVAAQGDGGRKGQQEEEWEEGAAEDVPSLNAVSSVTSGAAGMRGVIALAGAGGIDKLRRFPQRRPSAPIAAAPAEAQQGGGGGGGAGAEQQEEEERESLAAGAGSEEGASSAAAAGECRGARSGRKRNSFFRIIYADERVLVARGREGGVALWTRQSHVPAFKLA